MRGDFQVRFRERLRVKSPLPTRSRNHLIPCETQHFIFLVESKLVTAAKIATGNGLETSETLFFALFCADTQRTTFTGTKVIKSPETT